MAVAALPGRVKRSAPRWRKAMDAVHTFAIRLLTPARPVLRNLAQIPLTVAGWGCLSAAAFHAGVTLGLAATGVILMVLEHQIADET